MICGTCGSERRLMPDPWRPQGILCRRCIGAVRAYKRAEKKERKEALQADAIARKAEYEETFRAIEIMDELS